MISWAGNTALCDEARELIEAVQPEVIVVQACGATWKRAGSLVKYERTVVETLQLAPWVTVVATHPDAVDHAIVGRDSLRSFIKRHPEGRGRLHMPTDGERPVA